MLLELLYPVVFVVLLGVFFGLFLSAAGRFFAVHKDEREAALEAALPGINCGACGFAGCSGYAAGIVAGNAAVDLCSPGGAKTQDKINAIMGLEDDAQGQNEKMIAQIFCRGAKVCKKEFKYDGIEDCNALFSYFRGDNSCKHGCLGRGSCIEVCPVAAIYRSDSPDSSGLILIDAAKCIGCEKCLAICPVGVIKMIPQSADVMVACHSTDKGPIVKKNCSVGCIGCKLCVKKSPEGGFTVENFLAAIDYSQKGDRQEACKLCPAKTITPVS